MTARDRSELHDLALSKLSRVIGLERSREELGLALARLGLDTIATVDDLGRVADALQQRSGFVGTIGAMLAVDVAMRRLSAS